MEVEMASDVVSVVSEKDIVKGFYLEHSSSTSGAADGNEIALYKYVITIPAASASTPENQWVDGNLFSYVVWRKNWAVLGTKVKFYIMGPEYNPESKRKEVYMRVDELMKLPGCSSVITPFFATYNSDVKRVVVCYPYFDQLLKDWLPVNQVPVGGHTLPPVWSSLIRDLLPCIPTFERLHIKRLEDKSSYVWLMEPNEIRVVLFPESEEPCGGYLRKFATFLRDSLYNQWKNDELLSFVCMLESSGSDTSSANLQRVTSHPLLQDLDAISVLIRTTWRPSNAVSLSQNSVLNTTIIPTKWCSHTWKSLPTFDAIMIAMLAGHSDDAAGLFAYVKEICAHYTENCRKKCGSPGQHPVSRIRHCFPGLVADIYKLSLDSKWLMRC